MSSFIEAVEILQAGVYQIQFSQSALEPDFARFVLAILAEAGARFITSLVIVTNLRR